MCNYNLTKLRKTEEIQKESTDIVAPLTAVEHNRPMRQTQTIVILKWLVNSIHITKKSTV